MGTNVRRFAIDAIVRIDDGAYANVLLPKMLAHTDLDSRDKRFATELVYGSTRRKRAHDYIVDKFLIRDPPPLARAALRVGTHQIVELQTPAHAAVSATVEAAPAKFRGLVNAVLRKVSVAQEVGISFPSEAIALSYPDWIVARLSEDLGSATALEALSVMNLAARSHLRQDGYTQDPSSAQVAKQVPAQAGDLVLDLCAAPGGKATAIAGRGAAVVAVDSHLGRAGLLQENVKRLGYHRSLQESGVAVVVADGTNAPFTKNTFDAVLVDAPCSGLGVLRRRPDARWRIKPHDIDGLVVLQQRLLCAAAELVVVGGSLIYSVCTLTRAETNGVLNDTASKLKTLGFEVNESAMSLPTDSQDGMFSACWTRRVAASSISSRHD